MDPKSEKDMETAMTGEEIVISGISGQFPSSENISKLIDNLYNKVDMVSKINYPGLNYLDLPQNIGLIDGFEKFDPHFFRVTPAQTDTFDPAGRKILEHTYMAMFDAGINPETLKGTKMGVFIGSSISDNMSLHFFNILKANGFIISGSSKTMLSNRVSYWIDTKGPSCSFDNGCVSSMTSLEYAVERIKAGDCESAIVGGSLQSLHPIFSVNMKRSGLLCLDGKTKCFDKNGDGFVRSNAVNVLFLQKAKDAKRIYTEVYKIKGKYFSKPDALGIPLRKPEDIEKFLEEFYTECEVSPKAVEYVEANATGISEADANELQAIGNFFGGNTPIKVGSIKSNMGNTIAVSGACSLTKICLAYHRGEIPANLHYNEPQNQIAAVRDGKVQVVTENMPFNRTFMALNNFSISGCNYHVLLKGYYKEKKNDLFKSKVPRLVLVSGRQDKCVNHILDNLENSPVDYEQLALLNNVFKYNIPGHTGRGHIILDTDDNNQPIRLARGFEFIPGSSRPVWFLYSGMGSQWATMAAKLMDIEIFAAAIEKCDMVLKPKGLDIKKIISENDQNIFDNILNSFVGITAIQIGLTDVLKAIGITADNIIGHSVGEIGCAYADGCFTAEEAILIAYYRGIASIETKLIKGAMAAVGVGHRKVRELCPPEIDIACRNSSESTTISGPAEVVEKLVSYLNSCSIFAKTVASANIAFHSRYIADAGPLILAKMKEVLKTPKKRSNKWLSTCFSPKVWSTDTNSQFASPEYFTYNLLNTVNFEETANMIPADAIVIEIAPHGLLQAIMKRSHATCLNIPLARRGEKNTVLFFLKAVAMLYQTGLNPDVDVLYPKIDFPVSTETPVISHLVEWEHSENWGYSDYASLDTKKKTFSYSFDMSIYDDDYIFLRDFTRNGINVIPESAILVIVWETVAMFKNMHYKDLPIVFTYVKFHDEVRVIPEETLTLNVNIQRGCNLFEVTHNDTVIASGCVEIEDKLLNSHSKHVAFEEKDNFLNSDDIYKLMSHRGYNYKGKFQSLQSTNMERTKALLKWEGNWITFLDSLFQLNDISRDHDGISSVKLINKLAINTTFHEEMKYSIKKDTYYSAQILNDAESTHCGGVIMSSIVFNNLPKLEKTIETINVLKKIIHSPQFDVDLKTALQVNIQVISSILRRKLYMTIVEGNTIISSIIKQICDGLPTLNIEIDTEQDIKALSDSSMVTLKSNVIVINDFFSGFKVTSSIYKAMGNNTFIIAIDNQTKSWHIPNNFKEVRRYIVQNEKVVILLEKKQEMKEYIADTVDNVGYYYIPVETKTKLRLIQLNVNGELCEWVESSPVLNKNTIRVSYSGIAVNYSKKSVTCNLYINKCGTDFSGIDAGGNKVMGIVEDNCIKSVVEVDSDLLWPVPQHWSLEEAATVPLPYIHAYYCLKIRSQVKRNYTVFVGNGDSEFGQAVISLCLGYDCLIFTTVNSNDKKKIMLQLFPELHENQIGYSKDVHFKNMVLCGTKGRRCDIVIDGSKGKFREAATGCVGFLRTYLDVSDHDMEENEHFGMDCVNEDRVYKAVRFSNIFLKENFRERKYLQELICDGIASGVVRPLTHMVYKPNQISRVLRLLSNETNVGRVLIKMQDPSVLEGDFQAVPRVSLSLENVYIVIFDSNELGIKLIDHLVQRGARRFLIHMKSKLMNGFFHIKYASWKKNNVIVNFNADDLHTKSGCDNLLIQGKNQGHIDGIFITHYETEDQTKVIQSNVNLALVADNLDLVSQKLNSLSYFAVIILASRKSFHKNNYSDIEKCCSARNSVGLPSMLLRYGINDEPFSIADTLSKLLNASEVSLRHNYTNVLCSDAEESVGHDDHVNDITGDGFGVFFRRFNQDEVIATDPVIIMKTKLTNENENEIYLDPDENHLLIIPGFDGIYQTMTGVSERLKIPAVTLQLDPDCSDSIPEVASQLMEQIKMRFHLQSKFYLLGYSFGVNIALELAALLEKEGYTGIVFCLDSSPEALKTQLHACLGDMTIQQLQNSLIEYIYSQLAGKTSTKLTETLIATEDWHKKIDVFIDIVKDSVSNTHEYLKGLIDAAYKRIILSMKYKPDLKLDSELILIKGTPHPRAKDLADDYDLSQYSTKQVKVFNIRANHASAPKDCRVSNIINKMLEPAILEKIKTQNLCHYYYA